MEKIMTLPDNLRGRSIYGKVIPTSCNLKNMLMKLVEVNGDYNQLKQWEKQSYRNYQIDFIQERILFSKSDEWVNIIREHILSKRPSDFGASVIDIYLVAYAVNIYGEGKANFCNYVIAQGITENFNSAGAIWQVGKGDGVYLGILNENGTIKDWNFIMKWAVEINENIREFDQLISIPRENLQPKNILIETVITNIEKYYSVISDDENGRYKSWEHCYKYFSVNRNNPDLIDTMCLHLAFYLASWGMLRNSLLLQKDYLVHIPVVRIIIEPKYNQLWAIKAEDILKPEIQNMIIELKKRIEETYPMNNVTDTLFTKILMGTFGCVPAYDRFFIDGIKEYKISSGKFSIHSLIRLSEFYKQHNEELEICRNKISQFGIEYPQMKIIDMCFWQIGFDIDKKEREKNKVVS